MKSLFIETIFLQLIGWLIASWKPIKVVSVAPLALFFFTWRMLPESPRWLVTKGRTQDAVDILTKIAETNNVRPPADLKVRVEKLSAATKEESLGYLSLFSSKVLAIRQSGWPGISVGEIQFFGHAFFLTD